MTEETLKEELNKFCDFLAIDNAMTKEERNMMSQMVDYYLKKLSKEKK
jgi:hypothetical protein